MASDGCREDIEQAVPVSPGYAFERLHMHPDPTGHDTLSCPDAEGGSPDHSAHFRSHLNLNRGLSWKFPPTLSTGCGR